MKPRLFLSASAALFGLCSLAANAQTPSAPAAPAQPKAETVRTQSGLLLTTLRPGTGAAVKLHDDIAVRFTSYAADGQMLDTGGRNSPVILRPADMFAGLRQGLLMMRPGGLYELHIPARLGYGDDELSRKQAVTYRIEIVEILPAGR